MADIKDLIVEAAEKLFLSNSCQSIGIERIAKEANVSKVTVYKYFSSKEEIVAEVLDKAIVGTHTSLADAIAKKRSGLERVREIFRWHERWFGEPGFRGCLILAALNEYKTERAIIERATLHTENLSDLIRSTLSDLVHSPVAYPLSRQLVLLLYGANSLAQSGRGAAAAQDAWECAQILIDLSLANRCVENAKR